MPARFDVDTLAGRLEQGRHDFAEFFHAPSGTLSLTIAVWPAGSKDDQQPHTEDEVYCVLAGRGRLLIGDDDAEVAPGSVAYVEAGLEHRFHQITEDLTVLVFWAPPRSGRGNRWLEPQERPPR